MNRKLELSLNRVDKILEYIGPDLSVEDILKINGRLLIILLGQYRMLAKKSHLRKTLTTINSDTAFLGVETHSHHLQECNLCATEDKTIHNGRLH